MCVMRDLKQTLIASLRPRFPAPFLTPRLSVCLSRCLIVQAQVWSDIVVDINRFLNTAQAVSQILNLHVVEPFSLNDPVDSLGHSVFQRISAFGHRNPDASGLQNRNVLMAAILAASI